MLPSNFHLQTVSESQDYIEKIYKAPNGEAVSVLQGMVQNQLIDDMYLNINSSKATTDNRDFDTLSLVLARYPLREDVGPITEKKDYDTVYELNIEYISKPLESAAKYRCYWNYDLYYAQEETKDDLPGFPVELGTYTRIDQAKFPWRFSQTAPSPETLKGIKYNWVLKTQRTKPGQESYFYPAPTVQEKIYFKKESKAVANLQKAGKLEEPKVTFGYIGEWLAMPDGVRREGKYYVTVNMYKFANVWDKDLYNAVPNPPPFNPYGG